MCIRFLQWQHWWLSCTVSALQKQYEKSWQITSKMLFCLVSLLQAVQICTKLCFWYIQAETHRKNADDAKLKFTTRTSHITWQYIFVHKKTIMNTLHSNWFWCKYPMKKSYQKQFKFMSCLAVTERYITYIIELAGFGNCTEFTKHQMFFTSEIHIVTTSSYFIILSSVILLHKLLTSHQNLYLFIKNIQ